MSNQKVLYRVRPDKFVTREMGEEMVMVPLSNNVADMTSVLTLNETGSDILKAIEEPATFDEVVTKLLDIYEIEKTVLEKDVKAFLKEAVDKKVIETINQARR